MLTNVEQAMDSFSSGFNCAQAVFSTYAPALGVTEHDALRIAGGFGAGMGRLQETCGAVTGAIMVIGCKYGMVDTADVGSKEKTYALVQQVVHRFRALHGSISCAELLGCDLNTAEGKKHFTDHDLSKTVCTRCVRDAATLIEEILL
jgi:C_GCAxxG_C_C family probable redox protein